MDGLVEEAALGGEVGRSIGDVVVVNDNDDEVEEAEDAVEELLGRPVVIFSNSLLYSFELMVHVSISRATKWRLQEKNANLNANEMILPQSSSRTMT